MARGMALRKTSLWLQMCPLNNPFTHIMGGCPVKSRQVSASKYQVSVSAYQVFQSVGHGPFSRC